jgi:protocatechuate 3,4-dioxygenase beta subunit
MQPSQTPPPASSSAPATPATSQAPTTEPPATSSAAPTTEPEDTAPDASETTDPSTTASAEGSGGSGGAPAENTGGAGGETAAPPSGDLTPPAWDDVPMCTASKTDGAGQGPFFIHNLEKDDDIDLFRQDIRGKYNPDAEDGIEMQLHLRILDSTSTECNGTPVADADIYIWHTDGQGYYSGFGLKGTDTQQNPDQPYGGKPGPNDLQNADRFCRGCQKTDANGVVSFRSFFPGWYNGRDVHIHFVAFKQGSMFTSRVTYMGGQHLFTTQFYFDPDFTRSVHESAEPYLRRTQGSLATAYDGAVKADEGGNSELHAKATFEGGVVVAQMQILLNPGS